ncbi:uncharacterized protein LOC131167513 [Malania oleifera]|uniref:uncharacterized protein LOC131167513 n=1 Tax=Malania oleifera TaxID=397392 RepID=UPI0025AE0FEB|nr:uncharacterized protein LOC131167513 [Malania oleifera]
MTWSTRNLRDGNAASSSCSTEASRRLLIIVPNLISPSSQCLDSPLDASPALTSRHRLPRWLTNRGYCYLAGLLTAATVTLPPPLPASCSQHSGREYERVRASRREARDCRVSLQRDDSSEGFVEGKNYVRGSRRRQIKLWKGTSTRRRETRSLGGIVGSSRRVVEERGGAGGIVGERAEAIVEEKTRWRLRRVFVREQNRGSFVRER